jgi:hypothetical protein
VKVTVWRAGKGMFYAHSTLDPSGRNWQISSGQLLAAAEGAGQFGSRIGIGRAARLTGCCTI